MINSLSSSFVERGTCLRCARPQNACLCEHLVTLPTRTRVVILMHPKEFKREKAATGKLTHACLPNSEIQWDVSFLENKRVNELINDPTKYPVLLYPGDQSLNVSQGEFKVDVLGERELVVFVLDGTWPCAKKMLKLSTNLQTIPRLMFTPTQKSQFVIKQQPHELCLSTLESVQQFLQALSQQGFEEPHEWESLLRPFMAMQQYQIDASRDPNRQRYRKSGGYKTPEERGPIKERSRKLFF